MLAKDKSIQVKKFNTTNAAVKAKFNITGVADILDAELKNRLTKQGYSVSEKGAITIQGEFVMINEGSRFLRWFIGPFGAGATKLEVEGKILEGNKELQNFNLKQKGYGGFGGGNSENLLKGSAKTIAKKVVKLLEKM